MCTAAQRCQSFLPLEIRLHWQFSLLRMAAEKTSDAVKPPSPKCLWTETEESIASLNIGDLRSLIRDTVLDVVKATSSEGTVPEAGGSGSSATKGDSGKLARVAGRSKPMSIGGSEVACVAIRVPRPSSWVSKARRVAGA